jgi:hypothetical protein
MCQGLRRLSCFSTTTSGGQLSDTPTPTFRPVWVGHSVTDIPMRRSGSPTPTFRIPTVGDTGLLRLHHRHDDTRRTGKAIERFRWKAVRAFEKV